jgi:hypothetical protein
MQEGEKMNKLLLTLLIIFFIVSCGEKKDQKQIGDLELKMNGIAEGYVKLVLEVGKYDPMYVDAYYGPKEWQPKEKNLQFDSTANSKLISIADSLLNELELLSEYNATEIEKLRFHYLYKQLFAVKAMLIILDGSQLPFRLESRALYDVLPPIVSEDSLQKVIDELDKILPGEGDVTERMIAFNKKFEIPKNKISKVFDAAVKECKERTSKYINLPSGEKFKVEYVTDKPWGAYNWYKGNLFSVIQVATDFPVYIDGAIGLAAHEGYPGHHVYNILLEEELVKKRGWVEYTVYPLYSPQSLIAEGTAVIGEDLLFPGDERKIFAIEVLFPLAGLSSIDADLYYQVLSLIDKLDGAGVYAARNYLNGDWSKDKTIEWLQKYQLRTKERAEKYLSFIETYRSYVVTYNTGKIIIEDYLNRNGGTKDNLAKRWEIFTKLISTPQTPSGLQD